jgi:hypothetical protein
VTETHHTSPVSVTLLLSVMVCHNSITHSVDAEEMHRFAGMEGVHMHRILFCVHSIVHSGTMIPSIRGRLFRWFLIIRLFVNK